MKKFLFITLFLLSGIVFAENYRVYSPENINSINNNQNEKLLFILDFSNSMTESLTGETKLSTMLNTMKRILPTLNDETELGLRVYGHKMGFTPFDACRASALMTPIKSHNSQNILSTLEKIKPRGMTPITFSLKQAVTYDFGDYQGLKHIILLTDGGENCDESPCKYAMELVKLRKDIKIDVIAFDINNEDDLAQLECTSLVTSGKFYNANTSADLIDSLNNSLNKQKKVEAKIILPP